MYFFWLAGLAPGGPKGGGAGKGPGSGGSNIGIGFLTKWHRNVVKEIMEILLFIQGKAVLG